MNGFIVNIEEETKKNKNYRKVLFTAKNSQLVVMSLAPGEDIGKEVHQLDQFIRIEQGEGLAVLDGVEHQLKDDWAIIVPAGVEHNITNTSNNEMKLYTVYSPPQHKDGIVQATKEDALADEENH